MLVGERMKYPVITVPPEMSLVDAVNLMKKEHIRRTPVVKDGKLIGLEVLDASEIVDGKIEFRISEPKTSHPHQTANQIR